MFISLWRLSTRWAPAANREWLLYVRPFRNRKREKKEKHKIQFIEFEKAGLHSPAEATNFCWPNCDHHGSTTITTNTMSKWWLWQRPALAAVVSSGGWCKAGGDGIQWRVYTRKSLSKCATSSMSKSVDVAWVMLSRFSSQQKNIFFSLSYVWIWVGRRLASVQLAGFGWCAIVNSNMRAILWFHSLVWAKPIRDGTRKEL